MLPPQPGRAGAHPAFPLFLGREIIYLGRGKGRRRRSGVHLVPVDVGEAEVQSAEGDGPPQLHQVPVVRLVLHDVAHALVDDHLADDIGAQRPQDVGSVAQLPRSEVNLVEWVHGDPREDLEGSVDVAPSRWLMLCGLVA